VRAPLVRGSAIRPVQTRCGVIHFVTPIYETPLAVRLNVSQPPAPILFSFRRSNSTLFSFHGVVDQGLTLFAILEKNFLIRQKCVAYSAGRLCPGGNQTLAWVTHQQGRNWRTKCSKQSNGRSLGAARFESRHCSRRIRRRQPPMNGRRAFAEALKRPKRCIGEESAPSGAEVDRHHVVELPEPHPAKIIKILNGIRPDLHRHTLPRIQEYTPSESRARGWLSLVEISGIDFFHCRNHMIPSAGLCKGLLEPVGRSTWPLRFQDQCGSAIFGKFVNYKGKTTGFRLTDVTPSHPERLLTDPTSARHFFADKQAFET